MAQDNGTIDPVDPEQKEGKGSINDNVTATGELHIVLRDKDGNIKQEEHVTNLVVTLGKGFIAARMKDATIAAMGWMAIGSGVVAAAVGDSALGTELGRVALGSTTVTGNQIAYQAYFPPGVGTGAITEAGLLNADSVGLMLARTIFLVKNKESGDSLGIGWTITIN